MLINTYSDSDIVDEDPPAYPVFLPRIVNPERFVVSHPKYRLHVDQDQIALLAFFAKLDVSP